MSDYPGQNSEFSVQVVGAAILDSLDKPEALLVGRRSAPAIFAGLWEFPGGKVEQQETCQQALARELHEELGITVRFGEEVKGSFEQGWRLNERAAMRVFCVEIIDGVAAPLEDHSELRWVKLGQEAQNLDWIPADIPIIAALRDFLGVKNNL